SWLKTAQEQFMGKPKLPAWCPLVQKWVCLEVSYRSSQALNLVALGCPWDVGYWARSRRASTYSPQRIGNSADFSQQFQEWWRSINPDWRKPNDGPMLQVKGPADLWSTIRKPGVNGLYLVLICLWWWAEAEVS
ncbi:hypothetical protein BT96DRAFT_828046, partial [Gymnopus androsaceus JB14]